MRLAICAVIAGVALVALAACNKPAPANAATAAAAPAATTASGPLTASQMPHRRPGLWRQVMTMDGASPSGPGMQLCIDEASEAKMSAFAQRMPGAGHCPPTQFTRNLDGTVTFSESCDTGDNGKASTTGEIKGDFNSAYTETMDTQYSGSAAPQLNGAHKMIITATWLGSCAPGQKGGDLILANGMKRNILDDEGKRAGAPQ